MNAFAIVDVQGFKTDANKFILKEIAISYKNHLQVFLIKSPIPFYDLSKNEKKQVSWIERNRKVFWREGFVNYYDYKNLVFNFLKNKSIYVKGNEKAIWIRQLLEHKARVLNLEDKGCPSLHSLYSEYCNSNDILNCIYHTSICAQKNVSCLRKWCENNKIIL